MANIINKDRPEETPLTPIEIPGMGRPDDSRVKGFGGAIRVTHPTLPLERTYCTNCGAPYGWVSTESYEFVNCGEVIVFCDKCDKDMQERLGKIPLVPAGDKNATEFPLLRKGSLPSKLGE